MNKNYAISDGGFVDELLPVINRVGSNNFVLVQLTREGCDYSTDSRRYFDGNVIKEFTNEKQTAINKKYVLPYKFEVDTYRIHNNGNLEDLHNVLEVIYQKEGQRGQSSKEDGKTELLKECVQ